MSRRPARACVLALATTAVALGGCGGARGGTTTTTADAADASGAVRAWVADVRARPHEVDVEARGRIGAPGLSAADLTRLRGLVPARSAAHLDVAADGEVVARGTEGAGLGVAVGPDGPPLASADGRRWRVAAGDLAASVQAAGATRQGGLVALGDSGLRLAAVPGSGGRRLEGAASPALVAAALPALARPGVLDVRRSRVAVDLDGAEVRGWTVTVQAVADLGRLEDAGRSARVGVAATLAASARAVAGVPALPTPDGTATSPAQL